MRTLRKVRHERSWVPALYAACLPILPSPPSLDEKASIIHIIKYKSPFPFLFVAQPVVHQLEDIGRWILSSRDLDAICYVSKALLKPGGIACVRPEHPFFRRAISSSISVFDGELRFALQRLAISIYQRDSAYPTPPRPTSAVRDPRTAHFW